MSYEIRTVSSTSFATGFSEVAVTNNRFDFTDNHPLGYSFSAGDVMHVKYYEGDFIRGVYGVAIGSGTNARFEFDQEIYPLTSTVQATDVIGATLYTATGYTKISTINFSAAVNRAVFSEEYKAYNISKDYEVAINTEARRFFGSFKDTALSTKMILVDHCENYAYGVSFQEERFNLVNNIFRNQLVFNVATR